MPFKEYTITDFGGRAGDRSATAPAARAALARLAGQSGARLTFPKGRYDFFPDRAFEAYYFISNNDHGLKHIAFPVAGCRDLTIDGEGSQFVFHGHMTPFILDGSRGVRLRNLSIDWERPMISQGEVLEVDEAAGTIDVRIPAEFPYKVHGGHIAFTGDRYEATKVKGLLEWDAARHETAWHVFDVMNPKFGFAVREVEPGRLRIEARCRVWPKPGNILSLAHDIRLCPGVAVTRCADVELEDVDIYHCSGMGVIAQLSADVRLSRVRVTVPPGSGRMISAAADASHFVNCRGLIELDGCLFERQMDDPCNVHGIYARIAARPAPDTIEIELIHPQQVGIDVAEPGARMEFVRNDTLLTYHEAAAASTERLNCRFTRVTFGGPLPEAVRVGDVVANLDAIPDLTIRNCTMGNNRARGPLVSTAGKVRIEGNTFHTPGSALKISGDANYWFESGKVRDVRITGNLFDNCNFGVWGRGAIDIDPEIERPHFTPECYHRNIVIENNRFRVFDKCVVYAR
ncbi:MAG: right-handed parallel beta-helix repeat-containing protein, partial [bacterium]|nr:right-handed parallel beta-helix repeat-containing protein [bacterium]